MKTFAIGEKVQYNGCIEPFKGKLCEVIGREHYPPEKHDRYLIDFCDIDFYLHEVQANELKRI